MAGDERHRRIDIAVRDRDAGIGKTADPGGDARDDAEWDPGLGECQCLLAAAAEDAGIAALEPQDTTTLLRQPDQPGRDIGLARRWPAAALAGMVERRSGPRQGQDAWIDERIIDHDIGTRESMQRQGGQ